MPKRITIQAKGTYYKFRSKLALVLLGSALPFLCFSQSAKNSSQKKIEAGFIFAEVEYNEMAAISNVLKVKNNIGKDLTFTIKLTVPNGWRTLNKPEKEYILAPGDSLFVPVRMFPKSKTTKGGIKYNISAFIATSDGKQLGVFSFIAGRPKVSNWKMHVLPQQRIYFLNQENTAPFQINLSNEGDEDQEVILSMNKIGKDFMVSDTNGRFLKKNYKEFLLRPNTDTIVPFTVSIQKRERNYKRIDTYGYKYNTVEDEKRYGLYLKAAEPGAKPSTGSNKSTKVDFVKLANNIDFVKLNDATKVNQFGSATIPLTVQANITNILDQQPVMNLMLNGNTQLSKKSRLDYSAQTGLSSFRYTDQSLSNANGVIGYYHEKGFLSIGTTVGLNVGNMGFGNGKGITGGINLSPTHTIGAFYVKNGESFDTYTSTSFGTAYGGRFKKIQVGIGYGQTNNINGDHSNSGVANLSFPLGSKQSIGVGGRYSLITISGIPVNGMGYSVTYNIRSFKGRGNTGISYNYNESTSNFASAFLTSNNKNVNGVLTNVFRFKNGVGLNIQNNFSTYNLPLLINGTQFSQENRSFNNVIGLLLPKSASVSYSPSVYGNYSDFYLEKLISYGLQLGVNSYNPEEAFRLGFFIKGGYSKLLNHPEIGTFFNAQTNTFLSYRTWNYSIRYSYGPQGQGNMVSALSSQNAYPQNLSSSLSNQYQFTNTHFLWENTVNYNYENVSQRHGMGLYSEFFYYNNAGWRFNINISYTYNISQSFKYVYSPGSASNFNIEKSDEKVISTNFQMGLGLKKDFGIPIPKRFTKARFCNANFKVFLDINGNKRFDADEVPLENIVIRMNNFEVLSNANGEASFVNMGLGLYKLQAIPLVDLGAWFAVIPDSMQVCGQAVMYVPFSKGVQILGKVELDREKFSGEITEKIDISRIKIFLIDSLGKTETSATDKNGDFKFYVPYGQYTLKLDEKVLGTNFELVQNDVDVDLSGGTESYYHTFYIIEKKRKVKNRKFGPDGKVIITEGEAGSLNKADDNKWIEIGAPKTSLAKKATSDGSVDGRGKQDGSGYSTKRSLEQDSLIMALNNLLDKASRNLDVGGLVKAEVEKLRAQLYQNFKLKVEELPNTIQLDVLPRDKSPQGLLLELVQMNKLKVINNADGSRSYTLGNYTNLAEAEQECIKYRRLGFRKASVIKAAPAQH